LLTLPRLGNPYLSQLAYSTLTDLLASPSDDDEGNITPQVPNILMAILSSPPTKTDATLSPSWLLVVGHAMLAYNRTDEEASASELGKVWKTVWQYLDSSESSIRKAAADSLGLLTQCFSHTFVERAVGEISTRKSISEAQSSLCKIISQTIAALDSLAFARSIPELLSVIASVISNLQHRSPGSQTTAAEILASTLIEKVGALRAQKSFDHKEAVDAVLGVAMQALGPEALLRLLPLNLEPTDRYDPLLPLAFNPHSNGWLIQCSKT
jgi:ribosomal RNA-processing protein 12